MCELIQESQKYCLEKDIEVGETDHHTAIMYNKRRLSSTILGQEEDAGSYIMYDTWTVDDCFHATLRHNTGLFRVVKWQLGGNSSQFCV